MYDWQRVRRSLLGPLAVVMALALLVVVAAPGLISTAEARPFNGFVPPGLAKKGHSIFSDLDEAPWAAKFIQAMWGLSVIHGYANGEFQPNKPVTRAEAVTMVVRALGWEEEAQEAADAELPFRDPIPAWARGYIAVALEHDLLPPVDGDGDDAARRFQPNKPATRAWVAALLARAAEVDEDLSGELSFADADLIPLELQALVRLAVELGWFQGYPGNVFKPNKPITRAEMAAVLDRFLDYEGVRTELSGYLRGTITEADGNGLTLKVRGGAAVTFEFADEVMVFIDDESATIADLDEGMSAQIRVVNGLIVFVDARSGHEDDGRDGEDESDEDERERERVDAVIYGITEADGEFELDVVTADGDRLSLSADENLPVYQRDDDGDEDEIGLDGLKAGDSVALVYEGDTLVAIELEALGREETGILVDIDLNGSIRELTIDRDPDDDDEDLATYRLAARVNVSGTVAGTEIDELDELVEGSEVTLTLTAERRVIAILVTDLP